MRQLAWLFYLYTINKWLTYPYFRFNIVSATVPVKKMEAKTCLQTVFKAMPQ